MNINPELARLAASAPQCPNGFKAYPDRPVDIEGRLSALERDKGYRLKVLYAEITEMLSKKGETGPHNWLEVSQRPDVHDILRTLRGKHYDIPDMWPTHFSQAELEYRQAMEQYDQQTAHIPEIATHPEMARQAIWAAQYAVAAARALNHFAPVFPEDTDNS